MNKTKEILLAIFLLFVFIFPRSFGLGDYVTVDEPFWIHVGSNFFYALGQHDFARTVYEYHPAVTTMWIVSAGIAMYFPQFRGLDQGYLKRGKFDLFLPEHGKDHLHLLIYSRAVQVVVIAVLLLIMFYLLRALFGKRPALFAVLFVSFSPFFFGHSRVLNHEAMLALFNIISILALAVYLFKSKHIALLAVSAGAGALAQLTKSTGFLLFPSIALLFFFYILEASKPEIRARIILTLKMFGGWVLMLVAFYFLFWPGMWVKPGKMLFEVYGNALAYFFAGRRVEVGGFQPERFRITQGLETFFPIWVAGLIWRSTIYTWLGFLLGTVSLFFKPFAENSVLFKRLFAALMLVGFLFFLVFTLAPGLDSPHYGMNAYVVVDIISALGLLWGIEWLFNKFPLTQRGLMAVLGFIIAMHALSNIKHAPYYYTYYNPILEALQPGIQNPTLWWGGYGEALDQAAAYLSQKPNAQNMAVMSFYGYGPFSFLFPGKTIIINELDMSKMNQQTMEELQMATYVVIDFHSQTKKGQMYLIEDVEPEKVIWFDGVEYIHIYRSEDLRVRYFMANP